MVMGDPALAEAVAQMHTDGLVTVGALQPEGGLLANRQLPGLGMPPVFSSLSFMPPMEDQRLPTSKPTQAAKSRMGAGEDGPSTARAMRDWAAPREGIMFVTSAGRGGGDTAEVDLVRVLHAPSNSPLLQRWVESRSSGKFMFSWPSNAPPAAGSGAAPALSGNVGDVDPLAHARAPARGSDPYAADAAAAGDHPPLHARATAATSTSSPGEDGSSPSCYIVGESTSDWRMLMAKLVQLERDLWLLSARVAGRLRAAPPAAAVAAGAGSGEVGGSPTLPPGFVDRALNGEFDVWFGLAFLCVTCKSASGNDLETTKHVMRAVVTHRRFADKFPLCARMRDRGRLGLLRDVPSAERLAAGAMLSSSACAAELATMRGSVAALSTRVDEVTSQLSALSTRVDSRFDVMEGLLRQLLSPAAPAQPPPPDL